MFNSIVLKRRNVFFRKEKWPGTFFFIQKGLVRFYYTLPNEKEVSSGFMMEWECGAPTDSFKYQIPSKESMVALEDCELFTLSFEDFHYALSCYQEFNYIVDELKTRESLKREERLFIICRRKATERFRLLLSKYPTLVQRVPKKLLASYIDLAPSQISRKGYK